MEFLKKLMRLKAKKEDIEEDTKENKEDVKEGKEAIKENICEIKQEQVSEQQFKDMLRLLSYNIAEGKSLNRLDKLAYMCEVFGMLSRMDDQQCTKAIQLLAKHMSDFKRVHYIYIYQRFRNYDGSGWYEEFTPSLLKKLCLLTLTLEEKISLLGLASFHSNGYLRQMAVEELMKLNHPDGLKFILIRCSDYISEIRNKANEYVKSYITFENMPFIIENIDYIQYIRVYVRSYEHQLFEHINEKVETFYAENSMGMTEHLIKGLAFENKEVQEYCINELVSRKLLNVQEAVRLIKTSKSKVITAKAIKLIIGALTIEELLDIKEITVKTKLHKTHVLIIEKLYHLGYYSSCDMLQSEVLSAYRSIRECARFVIKKIGDCNIKAFYKRILEENDEMQSKRIKQYALIGICEIADKGDIPLLIQELNKDYNTKTKKCLIDALSYLDFSRVKEDLISLFEQGDPKNMKYVSKVLQEHLYEIDRNTIYSFYQKSPYEHVRKHAAMLLCSLRTWERIGYAIEFCASEAPEIRRMGKDILSVWWIGYEKPPKGTVEAIQNLYKQYFDEFDEWTKNRLADVLKEIGKYYMK